MLTFSDMLAIVERNDHEQDPSSILSHNSLIDESIGILMTGTHS